MSTSSQITPWLLQTLLICKRSVVSYEGYNRSLKNKKVPDKIQAGVL